VDLGGWGWIREEADVRVVLSPRRRLCVFFQNRPRQQLQRRAVVFVSSLQCNGSMIDSWFNLLYKELL
jgi:hypothetical protein